MGFAWGLKGAIVQIFSRSSSLIMFRCVALGALRSLKAVIDAPVKPVVIGGEAR